VQKQHYGRRRGYRKKLIHFKHGKRKKGHFLKYGKPSEENQTKNEGGGMNCPRPGGGKGRVGKREKGSILVGESQDGQWLRKKM